MGSTPWGTVAAGARVDAVPGAGGGLVGGAAAPLGVPQAAAPNNAAALKHPANILLTRIFESPFGQTVHCGARPSPARAGALAQSP
jgi:hypothetical protein